MLRLRILIVALCVVSTQTKLVATDLIWSDALGIHRFDTHSPQEPQTLFAAFESRGLAYDAEHQRLIWTDNLPLGSPLPGGVVRSGSLAGGDVLDLVTRLTNPAGVGYDARNQHLIWTDLGAIEVPSAIFAANLDGSDPRERIRDQYLSEITDITFDASRRQLYFTYVNPLIDSIYTGAIACADLKDLSNVETVVSGLARPRGLVVDPQTEQLYWADAGLSDQASDGAIMAQSVDDACQPSGLLRTVIGGLDEPYGIALDPLAQDIYWTDEATGKIQRTNVSGVLPFFEDVRTGLSKPRAIVIVPEPSSYVLLAWSIVVVSAACRRSTAAAVD